MYPARDESEFTVPRLRLHQSSLHLAYTPLGGSLYPRGVSSTVSVLIAGVKWWNGRREGRKRAEAEEWEAAWATEVGRGGVIIMGKSTIARQYHCRKDERKARGGKTAKAWTSSHKLISGERCLRAKTREDDERGGADIPGGAAYLSENLGQGNVILLMVTRHDWGPREQCPQGGESQMGTRRTTRGGYAGRWGR
ncbi:hypothetical protein B0H13DRAFT_1931365 [Mycena leptocephala]|nr:hypothetical protein B0H13DRAFT_1931365 [Mycena leptocephala]